MKRELTKDKFWNGIEHMYKYMWNDCIFPFDYTPLAILLYR